MRSRRVPVLRLGSRGPGGDARSLRLRSQGSQAFAEGRTCRRDENRRETQNCRHFLRFVLQKCQQSQGLGGSWSRNAELSSLLDSTRVFASQKCQQSQGSGGVVVAKRRTVVFWTRLGSSRLKSVNSHRDRGGVVAERRTVVTFGLASGERKERGEEKREMRGERREERGEKRRGEWIEERREDRGDRREERRGERREERRGERREEGRERREEREVRR